MLSSLSTPSENSKYNTVEKKKQNQNNLLHLGMSYTNCGKSKIKKSERSQRREKDSNRGAKTKVMSEFSSEIRIKKKMK